MTVRRIAGTVALLGLLLSLGASAEATTSTIARGACTATISNWDDANGTHAYSYRTSSGSTSCGNMRTAHVFKFGASNFYGTVDYDYLYSRSSGWGEYVVVSYHTLRDGTIPDPGYQYLLWG